MYIVAQDMTGSATLRIWIFSSRPCKDCRSGQKLDNTLKLDTETFTFLYLVEQLEESVVVRSRKCQFVLYKESSICDMCSNLSKQGVDSYKDHCKTDDQVNIYEQIVGET